MTDRSLERSSRWWESRCRDLLAQAILLYYLTFKVQIFPTGSCVGLHSEIPASGLYLLLPWTTRGPLHRLLRTRAALNALDAMNEDYVRTARAKGLSERRVRVRHVFRETRLIRKLITLFRRCKLPERSSEAARHHRVDLPHSLNGVRTEYAADSITTLDLPPIMA